MNKVNKIFNKALAMAMILLSVAGCGALIVGIGVLVKVSWKLFLFGFNLI